MKVLAMLNLRQKGFEVVLKQELEVLAMLKGVAEFLPLQHGGQKRLHLYLMDTS